MLYPSLNWMEQVKNVAQEMIHDKQFILEGYVTSVDPSSPYKVKVMLEPYEIETGWLPIASPYVGNGFGLIFPAPEEGTLVKVAFDMGDTAHGIVISGVFNDTSKMPDIPHGTAGLYHKSGSSIFIAKDGSITVQTTGTVNVQAGKVNLGSGGKAIARVGDAVQVDVTTGKGTITSGSGSNTSS